MKCIHEDMSLKEILEAYPCLADLFKKHGLGRFESQEVMTHLGSILKLKTALSSLSINKDIFIKLAEDSIAEHARSQGFTLASTPERQRELTLLALLPCGMKMPFTQGFEAFAERYNRQHQAPLRYLIEGNLNHEISYSPFISSITSIEELPDIIISSDINNFYGPAFRRTFLSQGHFTDVLAGRMHPAFASVGYADPQGQFTMLSANLLVLVRVRRQTDSQPRPASWGDLLREECANAVVIRGQKDFFCTGVLLPFYALYGMEGVRKLARSVRTGCHPSEMVKRIDSGREDSPSYYVMPYFFAKKIRRQEEVEIIIPSEGALLSPVQMLVKKSRAQDLREITDFLCGSSFGQLISDANFPSTNPEVDNHLEGISPIFWLGWDFLASRDITRIKDELKEIFMETFKASGGVL